LELVVVLETPLVKGQTLHWGQSHLLAAAVVVLQFLVLVGLEAQAAAAEVVLVVVLGLLLRVLLVQVLLAQMLVAVVVVLELPAASHLHQISVATAALA
jgi:hypothetical protein